MSGLFPLHARDHRPRLGIPAPELFDVSLQVLLDLSLGLGEESEVPTLAQPPRGITEAERTRVPERVGQTQATAELRTRWALRAMIRLLTAAFARRP